MDFKPPPKIVTIEDRYERFLSKEKQKEKAKRQAAREKKKLTAFECCLL